MKTCTKCLVEKPFSEFYPNGKGGHIARCKTCKKAAVSAAQKLPENKPRQRRAVLKYRYGVTPEWYDETLAMQDGHCALCPATEPGGRGEFFSVDHDHATGEVRALLCHMCNSGLGWYENHKDLVDAYLSVPVR